MIVRGAPVISVLIHFLSPNSLLVPEVLEP